MRKVKIFSIFTSIILLCGAFSTGITAHAAFTPKVDLHSEGVYMVEMETNTVVVAKNENEQLIPASTTKIMTALVALENIKDFNQTVKITYDAMNEFSMSDPNYQGASTSALEVGQTNVTFNDCLYALMVSSGCEAGNVLALNLAGSIQEFVDMMNAKAKELGATHTHFVNPNGLHDNNHYTTAYDLYLIFKEAVKYDTFVDTVSSKDYTMTYTTPKKTQINEYMQSTNYYLLNEFPVFLFCSTWSRNKRYAVLIYVTVVRENCKLKVVLLYDINYNIAYKKVARAFHITKERTTVQ